VQDATRDVAHAARPVARVGERVLGGLEVAPLVLDERDDDVRDDRSWGKTAMVIGGSAAGGAGVGGIVGGKKGALIGAAIGGGAASIFEATQRR